MLENFIFLAQSDDGGGAGALVSLLCVGIIVIIQFASFWMIFSKAGKPGILGIIPIVNYFFLMEIVGRPWWVFILLFVPLINSLVLIVIAFDLAKSFGQGAAYGCGLLLLPFVFYPLLAFGNAKYQGPTPAF